MIKVNLFANYGHQYFFSSLIALDDDVGVADYHNNRLADPDDLGFGQPLLNNDKLRSLLVARARKDAWQSIQNGSYVRCRIGTRNFVHKNGSAYRILGIWFAVESNIGPESRGYPIKVETGAQTAPGITAPYAVGDPADLPLNPVQLTASFGPELDVLIPHDYRTLDIVWMKPGGKVIEVDLIVDFGNSRTAVFALEDRKKIQDDVLEFPLICRPVGFLLTHEGGRELPPPSRGNAEPYLIDSWFVFHETNFSAFEKPRDAGMKQAVYDTVTTRTMFRERQTRQVRETITRKPHAFIEMSQVVMGPWAKQLLSKSSVAASEGERPSGGRVFLSSPKRYAWDSGLSTGEGTYWTMVLNPWTQHDYRRSLPPLQGEVLRFVYADDRPWKLTNPPNAAEKPHHRPVPDPDEPFHARGCTMTLAALAILESAYRQITSNEWRRDRQEKLPRTLRAVQVTYPSGWTADEIESYRQKWQNALNIFAHTRLPLGPGGLSEDANNPVPTLRMSIDEAVAAQLPIVYTQIRNLRNVADSWARLYGRPVAGNNYVVRVMSVDIGGGTTDTSIVEYRNDSGSGKTNVNLKAKLLFKDSSTTAGDHLVKTIIERALLPALAESLPDRTDQRSRDQFRNLFARGGDNDREREDRAIIARLVFMPLVVKWLQDISKERQGPGEGVPFWSMDNAGCDPAAIAKLSKLLARASIPIVLDTSGIFQVDYELLKATIGEVFRSMASLHAQLVAAYNCDLVIVTGKVSELPQLKSLFEQQLPLPANRILSAKGYDTQAWFPLTENGEIPDAKLVTAVGAALARAIERGGVQSWEPIAFETAYEQRYCWGHMPPDDGPFSEHHVLIADNEELDIKDGNLVIKSRETPEFRDCYLTTDNTYIGRHLFRMSDSRPEQVYHFQRVRVPAAVAGPIRPIKVKVRLRRESESDGETFGVAERLVIEEILEGEHENGEPLGWHDVELKLCTLIGGTHWLDNGQFDLRWKEA